MNDKAVVKDDGSSSCPYFPRSAIMQNVLNPLVTMVQLQLDASRSFADVVFSGTEKIDRVMIDATHRAFTDQINFAQALASMRDPRNATTTLQATFTNRGSEESVAFQQELMQIFTEMQNGIGRSMQEYAERLGRGAVIGAAAEAENLAAQADGTAFNPVTSMFSVWQTAFREAASLTRRNMMAAQSTVDEVSAATIHAASAGGNGGEKRGRRK
jgi:Phasin protein